MPGKLQLVITIDLGTEGMTRVEDIGTAVAKSFPAADGGYRTLRAGWKGAVRGPADTPVGGWEVREEPA